ncbi:helix-turn-helix transcriptional regulator [Lysobacter korlensis]|uniref:Helix-turn-helix transcriptional regulator n=1 Tax=Lysobacter korlensis TaxID=553636 RepID=A0ABV6RMX4_9GAMM
MTSKARTRGTPAGPHARRPVSSRRPHELQSHASTKTAPSDSYTGDRLLDINEVAEILRVSVLTIYDWRYKGRGIAAVKLGRLLRWRESDVRTYLANLIAN